MQEEAAWSWGVACVQELVVTWEAGDASSFSPPLLYNYIYSVYSYYYTPPPFPRKVER